MFVFLHVLFVVAGAFAIGVRMHGATQPPAAGDEDSRQLQRVASAASLGLFIIMLVVIAGLDLNLFHVSGPMK
jgi:hypothetical protein